MQSNVAICIIILSSIAFVILAWTFFARRRGEFKRALLVTHHIGQAPRQLQARDLSSDVPSSDSTQSRSTSSGGTVFDYRKAKKDRVQPKQGRIGRTWEMAGGLRRVDEPSMAATRESTTTAVNAGTRAEGPSKENREPEGWSGQSPPVDPLDGGWGGANTTQENQGGWGEENSNPGTSSAW